MKARVRRCRGCGVLLTAGRSCTPCDTATVHVITTLGPTDGPGRLRVARLLPPSDRDVDDLIRDQFRQHFDQAVRRDINTDFFGVHRHPEYGTDPLRRDPANNPFMRPRRTR